ncbi:MAG: phosphatidate cytidylyltransferase [Oscillatoria sp. SIO1A7]|nr:phosphatidate cytidylyltransferase [Oscillatoria sp. SIO1A7]
MLTLVPEFTSPPSLWIQLGVAGLWLGLVLACAEGLYKSAAADSEISRKIVHIGAGHVILLAWWLQIPAWVGIGASVIAGAIALLSYILPILPGINSVGRQSLGTFFYAVSIGVLIAWFWPKQLPQYATLGILIMAWGDGLAALIGRRFGRHPYQVWGEKKSLEGSLTMFLASLAVSLPLLIGLSENLWLSGAVAIATAIVATGLEAISKLGIDNLTVPIGSAAVAFFLNQSFF